MTCIGRRSCTSFEYRTGHREHCCVDSHNFLCHVKNDEIQRLRSERDAKSMHACDGEARQEYHRQENHRHAETYQSLGLSFTRKVTKDTHNAQSFPKASSWVATKSSKDKVAPKARAQNQQQVAPSLVFKRTIKGEKR